MALPARFEQSAPGCTIGSSCYRYNGETVSTSRRTPIPAAADAFPSGEGAKQREADEGRGAKTIHLQSGKCSMPSSVCMIVFCFSCILAEKFSFQREDGEYSDLRSRNLRFLRPRLTFSWSPTMAPFRANSIAVFGRSLSRTAPGEWLENLCSFIPGSVPNFGPRPGITRLQMRIKL